MKAQQFNDWVEAMELKSTEKAASTGMGLIKGKFKRFTIECKTVPNYGKSGKAFTSTWKLDGNRVAKSKLAEACGVL